MSKVFESIDNFFESGKPLIKESASSKTRKNESCLKESSTDDMLEYVQKTFNNMQSKCEDGETAHVQIVWDGRTIASYDSVEDFKNSYDSFIRDYKADDDCYDDPDFYANMVIMNGDEFIDGACPVKIDGYTNNGNKKGDGCTVCESLKENEELQYKYSVEDIRKYMEKDKKMQMTEFGDSEEEFYNTVDSDLSNINYIESSKPITELGDQYGPAFQGFDGGRVITYTKDGRKFVWEEGDEDSLSIWYACELVLSKEVSNELDESADDTLDTIKKIFGCTDEQAKEIFKVAQEKLGKKSLKEGLFNDFKDKAFDWELDTDPGCDPFISCWLKPEGYWDNGVDRLDVEVVIPCKYEDGKWIPSKEDINFQDENGEQNEMFEYYSNDEIVEAIPSDILDQLSKDTREPLN